MGFRAVLRRGRTVLAVDGDTAPFQPLVPVRFAFAPAAREGLFDEIEALIQPIAADDAVVRDGVMVQEMPFLQKPFTPERLANKISEVLGTA